MSYDLKEPLAGVPSPGTRTAVATAVASVHVVPFWLTQTLIAAKFAVPSSAYTVMSAPAASTRSVVGAMSVRRPCVSTKSGDPDVKSVTNDLRFGKRFESTAPNVLL